MSGCETFYYHEGLDIILVFNVEDVTGAAGGEAEGVCGEGAGVGAAGHQPRVQVQLPALGLLAVAGTLGRARTAAAGAHTLAHPHHLHPAQVLRPLPAAGVPAGVLVDYEPPLQVLVPRGAGSHVALHHLARRPGRG